MHFVDQAHNVQMLTRVIESINQFTTLYGISHHLPHQPSAVFFKQAEVSLDAQELT